MSCKKHLIVAMLATASGLHSQEFIDRYLTGTPVLTTIGTSADGLDQPRDLDFKPNTNELWVINYASGSGGTNVIFYNAGEPGQTSQFRKDSHSDHFMPFPTAIAFSDIGEWATTAEAQNSNFMGPSLWSGDTAIFARVFQNNWATGYPLGSHIDMLHQSPYGMGIAHESAKIYWVADGHYGNICKYDYVTDHGPGYDDHQAGKIWRYTDVGINRANGIPGHMVMDKITKWLYVVNAGTKEVFRLNTTTGTVTGNLTAPNEILSGYKAVTGATKETIATYTSQPCGIDYSHNRLLVGDHTTGEIRVYNTSASTPSLMGTITTGQPGIMGIKIGYDGKIWMVNRTQNKVYRLDAPPLTNDAAIVSIDSPINLLFEKNYHSPHYNYCGDQIAPEVQLANKGTVVLQSANIHYAIDGGTETVYAWNGNLAPGAVDSVTLPAISVSDGEHKLTVRTSDPNATVDQSPLNDMAEGSFRIRAGLFPLPFSEGFSTATFPPTGWSNVGFNKYCEMSRLGTHGSVASQDGCLKINNTTGIENITGQTDFFISPLIDLTQTGEGTTLDFEVAHAQYSSSSNDKLEVFVSDNCGVTWTGVYDRSGPSLATTTPSTSVYYPDFFDWRTEVGSSRVDLQACKLEYSIVSPK